jgi:hypothetical protein
MHRTIGLVLLLLSNVGLAQIESIINFNGQNAETINIDRTISVVRQVEVEVPSTCTRQVPYVVHECNDVTRHRQECSWVPERQECWTEHDRVCRPVTRYRQECHNGPSRRVCRNNPPRQVCTTLPSRQECSPVTRYREECSTGPSREVCHDRPGREVCTERPTREVCRTLPDGRNHCTTVGGGQTCQTVGGGRECRSVPGERSCRQVAYTEQQCRTVGGGQDCRMVDGGQSCHDEPGERICREVAYNDQDCHSVPRQQCRTVAGHNACRNIPYTEQVCGNVTRHRAEQYACTRREHQNVTQEKQLKGNIDVRFLTNGLTEEFPLAVLLAATDAEQTNFKIQTSLKQQPKVMVIAKKQAIQAKESEKEIELAGEIIIELLEPQMLSPGFPSEFSQVRLDSTRKILALKIAGQISGVGEAELSISRKPRMGRRYRMLEFKDNYPSKTIRIEGDEILIDLSSVLQDNVALNRLYLDLKLSAPLNLQGTLLNTTQPKTEQEYPGLWIMVE